MGKTQRQYKTDEICLSPADNCMYCPTAYKLKQRNFLCILNYLYHNFMKNMYHLLEFHFYHLIFGFQVNGFQRFLLWFISVSCVCFRCVHLIAELSHNQELHTTVSDLLPLLAKAASLHHYNHHVNFLETMCKQVSYLYMFFRDEGEC